MTFDLPEVAQAPQGAQPVELEFDLGDVGTAPTARFDPAMLSAGLGALPSPSLGSGDLGLTAVLWADLTSQGYVIGGEGSDEIMAAVATPPAGRPGPSQDDDAGTIDLGDVLPAQRPVEDEDEGDDEVTWTAAPIAPGGGIDFSAAPTPGAGFFGAPAATNPFANPASFGGAAMVSSGLFGGGQSEFSPLDANSGVTELTPPAAVVQARSVAPLPIPPSPVLDDDEPDDSDETIMFAPGALDLALAAAAAAAAVEAEAAPDPTPADPGPAPVASVAPAPERLSDDETVMISPGMLDAALLAEVAKAAGEESSFTPPATPAPEAAPTPLPAVAPALIPSGDEVAVRLFLLDHGINSEVHVELLSRLLREERVIGPSDFDLPGDLRPALDQMAQSRLLKRQRSARVKGGSGYLLAPSPQARGTVTRLARMWSDPQGRAKVSAWLNEG